MQRLKYRSWCHNYVIIVTSQIFCYQFVEYITLDTCVKFHDHRSNNKVIMGGEIPPKLWKLWWGLHDPPPPPPPWLTVPKSSCQIGSNQPNTSVRESKSYFVRLEHGKVIQKTELGVRKFKALESSSAEIFQSLPLPSLLVPTPFTKGGRQDPLLYQKPLSPWTWNFIRLLQTSLKVLEMLKLLI